MERVIVFPRSGYVNRLQAIASSALLAQDIGAEFQVCWEPQPVAASPAGFVFSSDFVNRHVVTHQTVENTLGVTIETLPRYLEMDSDRNLISLAGHDHGEQRYMRDLRRLIDYATSGTTLIITAGGHFHLPHDYSPPAHQLLSPEGRRGHWYRNIDLHPGIDDSARHAVSEHGEFTGLHLRYTDRSHEAPTDRQISTALESVLASATSASLFIASDVAARRDVWLARSERMGFEPWFVEQAKMTRDDPRSAHPALIDWRILGSASSLVYFVQSSFGHEAAVAAQALARSHGLSAGRLLTQTRVARALLVSASTWPQRRRGR